MLSRYGQERRFPVALLDIPGRCGNGTPRETTLDWNVHPPKSLPAARAHHCQKYSSGLDHKGYTAQIPRMQVAVHPSKRIEIGLSHPVKVQCWKLTTKMFPDKLASLEAGWLRKNSIYCSTCRFSMATWLWSDSPRNCIGLIHVNSCFMVLIVIARAPTLINYLTVFSMFWGQTKTHNGPIQPNLFDGTLPSRALQALGCSLNLEI